MKVLQIWLGNKLPAVYMDNISKTIDVAGTDNYSIITDQLIVARDVQNIPFNKVMQDINSEYNNILNKVFGIHPKWISDILRFYWLSKYEDTLYLDVDGQLLKKPNFTDLSFSVLNYTHGIVKADINAMYNGTRTDVFKDCFIRFLAIQHRPELAIDYFFREINIILRANKILWNIITTDVYKHGIK